MCVKIGYAICVKIGYVMCVKIGYTNMSKSGTRKCQKLERQKSNSWFAKNESPASQKSNGRFPISIEKQRKMKTGRVQKMNRRRSKNQTGRSPLIKSGAPQGLATHGPRGGWAGFLLGGRQCALPTLNYFAVSSVRSPDSKWFCVFPRL